MFSAPKLIKDVATILNTKSTRLVKESLALEEIRESELPTRLRIKQEESQDKLDSLIHTHITRTKLSAAEQAAVDAWKK